MINNIINIMDYSFHTLKENQTICRICLENTTQVIPLVKEPEEPLNILEKIHTCFQIAMTVDKNISGGICDNCIQELNIACDFRKKCVAFNERILSYYKELEEKDDYHVEIDTHNEISTKEISDVEKSIFQCSICKKNLKTEISLIKHTYSMHVKRQRLGKVTGFGSTRRYHCTKCSYSTPHSQTLINHMRRHIGDRPYRCDCGKSFAQSSTLTAHRKTHSSATFYTCAICGKQFKHAFALKKHQLVHENGKFLCDICNKYLKCKQTLKEHILRHKNVRNYNCEDCGKRFVTPSELTNHRKIHSISKNVECHLCGYKTHTKRSLIIHLKRHTGEKSYGCNLCLFSFYTSTDLQRHQRVHTRKKPFTCPTCTQHFTQSSSVNKHMISVHGVKYKWGDLKWKEKNK